MQIDIKYMKERGRITMWNCRWRDCIQSPGPFRRKLYGNWIL